MKHPNENDPQASGIATGAGKTEDALSTPQAAAQHKANQASSLDCTNDVHGQYASAEPAASKQDVASGAGSDVVDGKLASGLDRNELAKELESLHQWYRRELAKRHAEAIVHEQCPSEAEDEGPRETLQMFQERMMTRVEDAEFVIYARYGKTHPLIPSTPPHLSPPPKLPPGPPRIPPPIPLPARKLSPLPLAKVTRKPRNDPGQSGATGVPSGRADSPG